MQAILQKTFIDMNAHVYRKKAACDGGAACNLVLIDKKKQLLYNANIGDSRFILCNAEKKILFDSKNHDFKTDDFRIDSNLFCKVVGKRFKSTYVWSVGGPSLALCVSHVPLVTFP